MMPPVNHKPCPSNLLQAHHSTWATQFFKHVRKTYGLRHRGELTRAHTHAPSARRNHLIQLICAGSGWATHIPANLRTNTREVVAGNGVCASFFLFCFSCRRGPEPRWAEWRHRGSECGDRSGRTLTPQMWLGWCARVCGGNFLCTKNTVNLMYVYAYCELL